MAFNYTRGKADFGNLGADVSAGSVAAQGVQTGAAAGGMAVLGPVGGAAGSVVGGAVAAPVGRTADKCCACCGKGQAAQAAARQQAQAAAPIPNCAPGDTQCEATAKKAKEIQDRIVSDKMRQYAASVAKTLSVEDKQRFAAMGALAEKMIALHPDAKDMTVSQMIAKYPQDAALAYQGVQQQFDWLKNVDMETALAMNPGIGEVKLGEIAEGARILAQGTPAPNVGGGGGGGAMAAVLALLAAGLGIAAMKKKG